MLLADVVAGNLPDWTAPASAFGGFTVAGMFGSFLFWFARYHLPACASERKDRDDIMTAIVAAHEQKMSFVVQAQGVAMKEQRGDFKDALQLVIDHCAKENESRIEVMSGQLREDVLRLIEGGSKLPGKGTS